MLPSTNSRSMMILRQSTLNSCTELHEARCRSAAMTGRGGISALRNSKEYLVTTLLLNHKSLSVNVILGHRDKCL